MAMGAQYLSTDKRMKNQRLLTSRKDRKKLFVMNCRRLQTGHYFVITNTRCHMKLKMIFVREIIFYRIMRHPWICHLLNPKSLSIFTIQKGLYIYCHDILKRSTEIRLHYGFPIPKIHIQSMFSNALIVHFFTIVLNDSWPFLLTQWRLLVRSFSFCWYSHILTWYPSIYKYIISFLQYYSILASIIILLFP